MNNNKFIIAVAGSGKTTFLVNEALKNLDEKILITTYTEANEAEIRKKIMQKKNCIPPNITVQTWFSFLLQHGVRPFQGSVNDILWEQDIKGMLLSEGKSAGKKDNNGDLLLINGYPQYWGEEYFRKHYFSSNWKIYSDKISKFVYNINNITNGDVISRVTRIYSQVFIDEVQDLAGFDLELIKALFKSSSKVLLVGDPRQVTYFTHHSRKHKKKYGNGRVKEFLQDNCKSLLSDNSIDEATLKKSHRNNKSICDFSSKLYPNYEKAEPCECVDCRNPKSEHEGVFIVRPVDVDSYLEKYKPVQLRWSRSVEVNTKYEVCNFGESKGQTHTRVIIFPTDRMREWLLDNDSELHDGARAKFYVALTRARYSAAIVYDYNDNEINGAVKYKVG